MALSDHAISDRAISAPEDGVIIIVDAVGRVVLRHRATTLAELEAAASGAAQLIDAPAALAALGSAAAGSVTLRHARAGEAS